MKESNEEVKELIKNEIARHVKEEKGKLAKIIENKFLYRGEYVGARNLMDAVNSWAND